MNQTLTPGSAFTLILISILLAFLSGSIILGFGASYLPENSQNSLIFISMVVGQTIMVVPLLFYLYTNNESILDRVRLRPVSTRIIAATATFSIGIIIIGDEIDRIVAIILPQPDFFRLLSEQLKIQSLGSAIFMTLLVVFLAPLVEEIIFRGFLQKFLEERWRDITRAVLVTSLFFAVIHLNPFWLIQIYFLGLILGYLAWFTGSIFPPLILHAVNNAFALTLENVPAGILPLYTWQGHVSPLFLGTAVILTILGYKMLHAAAYKMEGR
jgi:membrane protease YdiL (CAAX protease family)